MLQANPAVAIAAILLPWLSSRVRTRVGARKTMERTRPCGHPQSDRPIRVAAVMKRSRTSGHIVEP